MIFVNDGSGSYTVLEHTIWDGMLLGDIVFPCFIWIMGVCIPIALSAQLKRGVSKLQISYSILKVIVTRKNEECYLYTLERVIDPLKRRH